VLALAAVGDLEVQAQRRLAEAGARANVRGEAPVPVDVDAVDVRERRPEARGVRERGPERRGGDGDV
jgi:hypothetical protein